MRKITDRIVPWLAHKLIRALKVTLDISYINREVMESMVEKDQNFIVAFWHGRLLMMPYCYPGDRICILISRHRDGGLIARTMEYFGYGSARGSTSEGGAMAVRELVRRADDGWDLAFTPDGPRGPRYKVQMGVLQASRMTGLPIIPVSFGVKKKRFSRAGIVLFFPLLSQRVCLFTVILFMCRGKFPKPN